MRYTPIALFALCLAQPTPAQSWLLGPPQQHIHPDWAERDLNGIAIAADGDVFVTGAMRHDHSGTQTYVDCGAAYVYRLSAGVWQLEAELLPFDLQNHSEWSWYFGNSLAINGDTIAVGAHFHDGVCPSNWLCDSGAVYVFRYSAGAWLPEQLVLPTDLAENDQFGTVVRLAGDFLFVGSPADADYGTYSGSVYVFQRNGSNWTQIQKLNANPASDYAEFGHTLAVADDLLVVGAPMDDRGGFFTANYGRAFVYRREAGVWAFEALLEADGYIGNSDMHFGISVSVHNGVIAVGAPGRHTPEGQENGMVYIFEQVAGVWTRTNNLFLLDQVQEEHLGAAVSLVGHRLIAGKLTQASGSTENVYVWEREGNTWSLVFDFRYSGLSPRTAFGAALTQTADRLFIGAHQEYQYLGSGNYPQVGAAYVFDLLAVPAYCSSNANSTGSPATLSAAGTPRSSEGNLVLNSAPVPNQFGIFMHAATQTQVPFGNGFLCITGGIVRGTGNVSSNQRATYIYDNSDNRHSLAPYVGLTRHFQHWYRDPMGGGAAFNTSDAISIAIVP